MAKRITLDKLAEMVMNELRSFRKEVAGGFASVHLTLDEHSGRFDRLEQKLDNTIGRVDKYDRRLEVLERR